MKYNEVVDNRIHGMHPDCARCNALYFEKISITFSQEYHFAMEKKK